MDEEDEVVWEWQNEAVALVQEDDGQMKLTSDCVTLLSSYDYPVSVVCLVGHTQPWKTYQEIVGTKSTEAIRYPQRAGIYYVGAADFMQSGRCMIVLSLVSELEEEEHSLLWDIALVMTSLLVYVDDEGPPIPRLKDTLELVRSLQVDSSFDELKLILPSFLWISKSSTNAASFKQQSFPFELPQPALDLSRLDHVGWFSRGDSLPDVEVECRKHLLNPRTKTFFGSELSGEMLLALVDGCLSNSQPHSDILGAWDHVVRLKCSAIAKSAMTAYHDAMGDAVTEEPPMEMENYEKLHADLAQVAISMYTSQARYKKAPQRRQNKLQLQTQLHSAYIKSRATLVSHSRNYCEAIIQPLVEEHFHIQHTNIERALEAFTSAYRAKAAGPAADQVLASTLSGAVANCIVQIYESAKDTWTDAMLADERALLHSGYEAKQAALTAHFQAEAKQLRETLAQEQRMWEKAQAIKQSRENIDGHEAKRMKDELIAAKTTIVDLQESHRKRDQEIDNWKGKVRSLEEQLQCLQATISDEANIRTSLVESLAESIRKEKEATDALDAATHQCTIGTQDLSRLLRTANEEKNVLQTKLNDLLVRITVLPPSLQEQVLVHHDGNVDTSLNFSDALSSYMSS